MEVINAEYSWNTRSTGFFRDPVQYEEGERLNRQYMSEEGLPVEIFGPGGLYGDVCNLLYGPQAGPLMAAYYRESAEVPNRGEVRTENPSGLEAMRRPMQLSYLPMMWDRLYAIPRHWRDLALDGQTWGEEITNERYLGLMAQLKLTPEELHRRLVRHWTVLGELNTRGGRISRRRWMLVRSRVA